MNLTQKVKKQMILAVDGHAFDEGTLLREVEDHEKRLASDPDVQRKRAEIRVAMNKESLPALFGSIVFNAVLWSVTGWFLRDAFEPWQMVPVVSIIGFVVTSALVWKTVIE